MVAQRSAQHPINSAPSLRSHASVLAKHLASTEGAQVLATLQDLELFRENRSPESVQLAVQRDVIGIWRGSSDGSWTRVAYTEAWNRFADVAGLPPKGRHPRVVLLGESVARAYFFDPVLTFATMIERSVTDAWKPIETVDLAAVGLGLSDLQTMVDRVVDLEPDLVVIFAGNNWIFEPLPQQWEVQRRDLWQGGDLAAAKELVLGEFLLPRTRTFFDNLGAVLHGARIPGVFVLPEYNLFGYTDALDEYTPALGPSATRRWMELNAEAHEALQQGNLEACSVAAEGMLALDQGIHAAGHRWMGKAALLGGREREARRYYQLARDAPCGLPHSVSPRCPERVAETIRHECAAKGVRLVDLPVVWGEEHGVAAREFFLDYCHLSLRGLELVAGQVAEAVVTALSREEHTAGAPIAVRAQIADRDQATAVLLAALHNAGLGAPKATVAGLAHVALEKSPELTTLVDGFLDFRNRRCADWLAQSFAPTLRSRQMRRYLATRPSSVATTIGQLPLYEALATAGARHDRSLAARARAVRLGECEHRDQPVDLLEYRPVNAHELDSPHCAFHRSRVQVDRFYLITDGTTPIQVELTSRANVAHGAALSLRVNGAFERRIPVGQRWRRSRLSVPRSAMRRDVNLVEIEWPPPKYYRRTRSVSGFAAAPNPYFGFGEIAALSWASSGDC